MANDSNHDGDDLLAGIDPAGDLARYRATLATCGETLDLLRAEMVRAVRAFGELPQATSPVRPVSEHEFDVALTAVSEMNSAVAAYLGALINYGQTLSGYQDFEKLIAERADELGMLPPTRKN